MYEEKANAGVEPRRDGDLVERNAGGSNIEGRNNKKQNVYGYRYNTTYSRTRS